MMSKRVQGFGAPARSVWVTVLFCLLSILTPSSHAESPVPAEGPEAPLISLRDEVLAYFRPLTGKVSSVEGTTLTIDIGLRESARTGMRLNVYREGVSFVHPVTKEPLGRVEIPVGTVEIVETGDHDSKCHIVSGKPEDLLNAKIKIPGTKVKVLFYQGTADWYLGDLYHRILKESGRFDLLDSGSSTADLSSIVSEAKTKGAEAVVFLLSEESKDSTALAQRLIWVTDAKQFSEKKVIVDAAFVRDLKFRSRILAPKEGEALLSFSLPFRASRIAAGDFDGDGNMEILLVTGNDIKVYQLGVDLRPLWEFKVPSMGDIVWIDTVEMTNSRKTALIVTTLQDTSYKQAPGESMVTKGGTGPVTTYFYELKGSEFVQILKVNDTFIRKTAQGLIGQHHSRSEGYEGSVFSFSMEEGALKQGEGIKLPPGVTVYDFEQLVSPDGRQAILAWDETGNLNLYDAKGTRTWVSKESFGGFSTSFKKESPIIMIDKGKWSIKDRLINKDGEVLAPKRIPLLGVAKGLGYKKSEIKSLWWNGFAVEERTFLDGVGGEILDFCVTGDRIVVLSKPLFGIKTGNILKGENPLGVSLYIFSIRGR